MMTREEFETRFAEKTRERELTTRQLEILGLVAAGYTDREIGEALGISMDTSRTHVASILWKLRAKTRSHAVAMAFRHGWLE